MKNDSRVFKREGQDTYSFRVQFKGVRHLRTAGTDKKALALLRRQEFLDELKKQEKARHKALRRQEELKALGITEEIQKRGPVPTLAEFTALPTDTDPGGQFWSSYATNQYRDVPNTIRYYYERVQSILQDEISELHLGDVTTKVVKGYLNRMKGERLEGSTINHNVSTLRLILKKAREFGLIAIMPESDGLRQKERKRGIVITPEQEKIYLDAVNSRQQLFFMICIDTAADPGRSVAGLAWADVHLGAIGKFEHGFMHIRKTKGERDRDLPLSQRLAGRLKEQWLLQGRPKGGYVFPNDSNSAQPTSYSTFNSVHQRLWRKTNRHDPIALPKFRLYDLRHTALTRLRNSGADTFDLMRFAGWLSSRMADRYIHADDASKARAAARLNAYIEAEQARLLK
jgi:integrase